MATIRLTMAEALVRFLIAQSIEVAAKRVPLFGGVFAIFGHGNVAGIGHALQAEQKRLPTHRAQNEQAMALSAVAYAKTHARRRMMACTTSIGPGATNMVTAAAVAHVNRLPVLFLPGDIFVSRRPDPVLQQVEDFGDATISANDCFRPVSRFFDRIVRPEQLLVALPAALRVLTDPVECGPVTLSLPQDVQTESFDYPAEFFRPRTWRIRAPEPDAVELAEAAAAIAKAKRPLILAGGGVKYARAESALKRFAETHGVPVAETQAGKGSLAFDHPLGVGALGVTGTAAANDLARAADLVLAIGARLGDFATGSRALFPQAKLVQLNVGGFDAAKHGALPLVADATRGLAALGRALKSWKAASSWTAKANKLARQWLKTTEAATRVAGEMPTDAEVLGAVDRAAKRRPSIVVCAAGGLPGELHKLWRAADSTEYHVEYGYSCMGYEIAGGLGAKLAMPEREVFVMVGDGSYLMMNSEIATSVQLGLKLTIVVLDNRGFGCIARLQKATGGAPFNNLFSPKAPWVDFAAHARSLGAESVKVRSVAELEMALDRAGPMTGTQVIVIDTDPWKGTAEGGAWWDVAVHDAPPDALRRGVRKAYDAARAKQRLGS
jgi:3D-(3,5/4)-trihydroxycyclohexane-1,2-dione acylhydrolase (decyclizing)